MKRKVHWDDEENEESSIELSEETSETEAFDEEDSSDEEIRIKDVLENLSQTVLLTCYTVWPLPKIFCSGLPAGNYFEINVLFP